jgi:hypothetical protein
MQLVSLFVTIDLVVQAGHIWIIKTLNIWVMIFSLYSTG